MTAMAIEKKEMDGQVVLAVETEEDFREALRISEKTGEVIAAPEALARDMGWSTGHADGGVTLADISAPGEVGSAYLMPGGGGSGPVIPRMRRIHQPAQA